MTGASRRALRLCLFATTTLAARGASAQPARPTARLVWNDLATPPCRDAAAFRAQLAERLGYDPFVADSPNAVTVSLVASPTRRELRVDVRDARDHVVGARTFSGSLSACDDLFASATLTLQLAFDPDGPIAQQPPLPPPPPSPPPPSPPSPITARIAPASAPVRLLSPPESARGVELAMRLGYGAFQDTSATAWIPTAAGGNPFRELGEGFSFDALAGLRVLSQLSLGLHGAYLAVAPAAEGDRARAWSLGLYARVYFAPGVRRATFDPWAGVGVDVVGRFEATRRVTLTGMARSEVTHALKALTLPLSAGFDVNVARRFALGVWGSMTVWFPDELCETTPFGAFCQVQGSGGFGAVRFEPNVAWQIGASMRYTIGW